MNIGTLVASLGVDTAGLWAAENAMKQFERKSQTSMANVQTSLAAVGARMQNFGRSATMYLTVPMALAGGAILKSAKDFEIAMQHIVGLVGVSQNQVNQWSRDILSLSPQIARPPKELAEALYFVTSSGIKGAAALDVVKQSAEGAASGLGETQAIADLVTSAMNAYKQSGLTATRALDVLTAAVREGKGEAAMYATQMGDVIPIASLLGVSFDQVASSIAAVSLTGQNVSETVTGLRQVLFEILKPAQESKAAMNNIMKMADAFGYLRENLREKGLLNTLGILNDLTKKYGVTVMADAFPNVRALTHALSLLGDRYQDNIGLFDRVNNSLGDHERALQAVKGTIDFEYNKAVANMRVGLIELGMSMKGSIIPILETMGNTVRSLANWYTNLSDTNKQLILTTAGLLAVIGPLSITVSVFAKLAANLFATLSVISGPIGLAIAGLAGLTVGIVAVVNQLKGSLVSFDNYKKSLETIGGSSKEFITNLEKEQSNIISLFSALRSANEGTTIRKNLIDIINQKYGEYLPNLLTEKTTLEGIDIAERNLLTSMRTKMAMRARDEKINAVYAEQMRREQEYFNKFAGQKVPLSAWTAGMEEYATSIQKGTQSMKGEIEAIIKMSNYGNGYMYTMEGLKKIFSEMYQYRKMDNKAIKETTNLYDAYIDKTEAAAIATKEAEKNKNINPPAGLSEAEKKRLEEINKIMKEFTEKENSMALMNNLMGTSFTTSEEKAKLYMDTLERLGEKGVQPLDDNILMLMGRVKALNVSNKDSIKTMMDANLAAQLHKESLGELNTEMYESALVGEDLRKKLALIAYQNAYMGEEYDQTTERIRTLKNMIQTLYEQQEKDPTQDNAKNLQHYIDLLKAANDEQKKSIIIYDNIKSGVLEISRAFSDVKSIKDFANAVIQAARNVILAIIAETVAANTAKAVRNSKSWWGAIIQGAAAMAATEALFAAIPKFAEGGTVPSGYPNDSYPAMLTSGEKVIPPQKLDMIDRNSNNIYVTVDGEVSGENLRLILKRVERRHANNY